jgi:hypothetical protein
MIESQTVEIYEWMNTYDNYKKGVTNKRVKEKFGSTYNLAWRKLKTKTKLVFYEDGKWYRWFD